MNAGRLRWLAVAFALAGARVFAQAPHPQQVPGNASFPRVKTHDDLQPPALPPLPAGMTVADIVAGDALYHNKGTCFVCHGMEGEGMPAAGDALTVGLNYAQYDWRSIDSLVANGISDELTRSPIQMPPRGGKSDLSLDEVKRVAAYVWAISQARGEPWPGGHAAHAPHGAIGAHVTPTSIRTRADSVPGRRLKTNASVAARGRAAIRAYGCGSCHFIPGVIGAAGSVGPPLDRWSRRVYIAGHVPNTTDFLIRWIEMPQAIEPSTAMPNLRVSEGEARAIAAYLNTLK